MGSGNINNAKAFCPFTQHIVFFHLLVGKRKPSERGGLYLHHRKGREDTSCRRGQKEVATLPSSSREEGIAHRTVTVKKRERSICPPRIVADSDSIEKRTEESSPLLELLPLLSIGCK
jgi:hypothetical protein